jgi:metal transporter CNNM
LVVSFFDKGVKPFTSEYLSPKVLDCALKHPDFIKEKLNLNDNMKDMYLYKYGEESDFFLIILNGSAIMEIGKEKTLVNAGLFSYYGTNALISDPNHSADDIILQENNIKPYIPEFSLKIEQYCVYFHISRIDWLKLVKNTNLERKKTT